MLVNESIQEYKFEKKNTGAIDFYKNESELLQTMREGDIGSLKNYVSKIIADTYRADGNPESIRMHASSVLAAAALEAVKNGADAEIVYKLQKHYYDMITNESSVDEITYLLWEALDSIFNEIMVVADSGNPYIRNALKYMSKNYSTPLTLTEVADVVGLSPNYFSALFSKSVGMSFREKLCRIRIEESKRLLLSTDYSLTDIAVSLGFNDQSYFCKVFKKITGLTPIQFRFRG